MEFFPQQSEDCLYLNVFAPCPDRSSEQTQSPLLPVVVYLYGGGFFLGSGSEHRIYDGSYLVQRQLRLQREPVIVVTLNYRVGVLGFLVGTSSTFSVIGRIVDLNSFKM